MTMVCALERLAIVFSAIEGTRVHPSFPDLVSFDVVIKFFDVVVG